MTVYNDTARAPSELQRLLLLAVPENDHGNKSLTHLAKLLKLSRWAVQKWIIKDEIPPNRAAQIVDLAEGRVSLADFSRFVYKL